MRAHNADDMCMQVRQLAGGIVRRACEDVAFADHLNSPQAAPIAAGLPEAAVNNIINETGMDSGVSGHMMDCQCTGLTCLDSDFNRTITLLRPLPRRTSRTRDVTAPGSQEVARDSRPGH
jgi:hypothetical protein